MKRFIIIILLILFSGVSLFAQEVQDSLNKEEKFDKFYYDFYVNVINKIDMVEFFVLTKENLWMGSAGPTNIKNKLLNKLVDRIGIKYAEKADSAFFSVKKDEMRDYMYQQYLHNRIVAITFDGDEYKVLAYDIE